MRATAGVILSLLLLASCGPPVMRSTVEEDAAAKLFPEPEPAKAGLYIYRAGHYAWAWPVDIRVVGAVKTPLPIDSFVRVDVPPGPNEVYCITNALPDRRRTELLADRVRYFQVTVNRGEWGPFCLVSEVSPEVGQAAVRSSRRIQPLWP
jgi:hypothetical protein